MLEVTTSQAFMSLRDKGPTVLNLIAFGAFGGISLFWVEFKFQKT